MQMIIDRITSTANPKIKEIKALNQKKDRKRSGLFWAEGIRLVTEAIQTRAEIDSVIHCPELLNSKIGNQTVQLAKQLGLHVIEVSSEVFASISSREGPQGLAAVVKERWSAISEIQKKPGYWVGFDSIQDSGNLGSVMRTLEAFGGKGVVLIGDCADPYQANAVRASTGAIFNLDIIKTSIDEFISWSKNIKMPIIATWIGQSLHYRKFNYPENVILLMGSEQKGLRQELLDICSARVIIPMRGHVDSLNLACSASIILAEIAAQNEVCDDK